jgi:hypothetical protein
MHVTRNRHIFRPEINPNHCWPSSRTRATSRRSPGRELSPLSKIVELPELCTDMNDREPRNRSKSRNRGSSRKCSPSRSRSPSRNRSHLSTSPKHETSRKSPGGHYLQVPSPLKDVLPPTPRLEPALSPTPSPEHLTLTRESYSTSTVSISTDRTTLQSPISKSPSIQSRSPSCARSPKPACSPYLEAFPKFDFSIAVPPRSRWRFVERMKDVCIIMGVFVLLGLFFVAGSENVESTFPLISSSSRQTRDFLRMSHFPFLFVELQLIIIPENVTTRLTTIFPHQEKVSALAIFLLPIALLCWVFGSQRRQSDWQKEQIKMLEARGRGRCRS